MDAKEFQQKIDFLTAQYVAQLVKCGHIPAIASNHLIQEITEVVDAWIQPKTNTQENK